MRVFVVGHRGMLGRAVARHLAEAGHSVLTSEARDDATLDSPLVRAVEAAAADAIVNAAGVRSGPALLATNGLLPQRLAALGPRVVHASSDGVFSGARGRYQVDEAPDARDPYGLSKRLGELALALAPDRTWVLRCSIVGIDPPGRTVGLLSWLLASRGCVPGHTDRLWNGITTLAWARLAARALAGDLAPGLHQPACALPVTKKDLLGIVARVFQHAVHVEATASGQPLDRTLVPTLPLPPIEEQLQALRAWASSGGEP